MKKRIKTDKKSFFRLLLKEYKNAIFILIILTIFFLTINFNPKNIELSKQGYQAAIIFFLAIILWSTNIIPLAITSLLILGLLSTYNVLESRIIYSFFGNSSLFFIIGAFIISAGVKVSGLSKRIAYFVIGKFGTTPFKIVLSIFLLTAILSHFMSEHAVAAMIFPVVYDIASILKNDKNKKFINILYFAMSWGCIIGGIVTFLGGARNPLAVGILLESTGKNIGFLEWIKASAPPTYILMLIIIIYFKIVTKKEESVIEADEYLLKNLEKLHKITLKEIKAAIILVITVFLWIFYNEKIGIANIAILSAVLYFALNVITWKEANEEINWGVIFMYGGAIALGTALNKVGLLEWFVNRYILNMEINKFILIFLIAGASIFLTEFMSNAAVIVVLLPIAISIATKINISPELVTLAIALPSGLAYMLPMSTPAMAIIYSTGELEIKEGMKYGIVLNILSWIIIVLAAMFYWPLIGIK